VNYASPWNRGLLDDWDLMDGDKKLDLSQGDDGGGDGVNVEKTYRDRTIKGCHCTHRLDAVETRPSL